MTTNDELGPDSILDTDPVRAMTVERFGLIFDSEEWHWHIDDDGDLCAYFDWNAFFFRLQGKQKEILNLMGCRRGYIPASERSELLGLLEDWHREKLWPKAYFVERSDDGLEVIAELNIDFEHGVTDAQLLQQFRCGISTTLQLFELIDERFGKADPPEFDKGEESGEADATGDQS